MPTDYYATGYLERDTRPHAGSSYKRIKDGLLQELVNYVMERSSDQRGLYRITVGEKVYTGLEIEKLYDQSDFPERITNVQRPIRRFHWCANSRKAAWGLTWVHQRD